MTQTEHYDAILIGSGQAAGPLATTLARTGRRTALIERSHVGGTCINEGCTPTKTMVASARVAYLSRRAEDYGVRTGPVSVDMVRIRQRKRDIVDLFRNGSQRHIEHDGVRILFGEGRFTGPRSIEVRQQDGATVPLTADTIFINTGARPADPPLAGLSDVPRLDSTTIMELDEVPEHLLILGGSYVGLEFGQMFRRFGSAVTIVQRSGQLLTREDPDIAEAVADIMRQDGIDVVLNAEAQRVQRSGNDGIQLEVLAADGPRTLIGSHLLVAAGRAPNTEALNLAAAGVETDERGFVKVNDRLETSAPNIYALGDVTGGPAFTHISYDDFRILRTNLLEEGRATTASRLVPYTIYIDPQLGRVGMSEIEARQRGRSIRVAKMPMSHVARALETDETRGLMKVIVDAETKQILGGAILGIEGGEIMSMLEIAIMGRLPWTTLRHAIFAHPTLAEAFNNLFARLDE